MGLVLSGGMWTVTYVRMVPALDCSTLSLRFDWLNGEDSEKVSEKDPLDVRVWVPKPSLEEHP